MSRIRQDTRTSGTGLGAVQIHQRQALVCHTGTGPHKYVTDRPRTYASALQVGPRQSMSQTGLDKYMADVPVDKYVTNRL